MAITLKGVEELQASFGSAGGNLSKELGTIVWKTGRHIEWKIAQLVSAELNIKQSQIRKKNLVAKRSADLRSVKVIFTKTDRPDLKDFKPRQNATGAAAKVLKSEGTQTIKSGFMGPKPGAIARKLYGHAWIRAGGKVKMTKGRYKGQMKQRIFKLKGVSPTAVFHYNNMIGPTMDEVDAELQKQLAERIRWNKVKQTLGR
jgi:hypothetical protein